MISEEFHATSKKARQIRYSKAVAYMFRSITYSETELIINNIKANRLDYDYIEHGREGVVEANNTVEGLFNYIKSTAGTSYENNGLLQKQLTFIATSNVNNVTDLSNNLMTILKEGIY